MTIKVYSTPICPYCVTLKDWLTKNGVEYQDINIAADEEARNYLVEKTQQMNVPVTEVDGEFIFGFDREKLSELLGIKD